MRQFIAALWPFEFEDRRAILLIILLPLLVALPQLVGVLKADPILYHGGLTIDHAPGLLKGLPYTDPNNAVSTQALGRHAAWQWLHGSVPWWNHYSGIGLPLAAEYQAGAFFPLTFLLLLPYGTAWMQVMLQIIAGLGTYGLLRQLGVGRMAATAGGLLYAFNGTLAWFSHAPAAPVPFLPWMLWGVERIFGAARESAPPAWGMLALSMALVLLASFPETAYLSGLLALAWTVLRGAQLPRSAWRVYSRGIIAGGLAGIAIASPQVYPFLEYLGQAHIGDHDVRFATEALNIVALPSSLFTPYLVGPLFAYLEDNPWLIHIWGPIGGYVTFALVVTAAAGFWTRRDAVGWLLLGWLVLTLARTFGVPGTPTLWNLIPGVSLAAFYRYMCPSWELAFVLLAARGIDAWAHAQTPPRAARAVATATLLIGLVVFAWVVSTTILWRMDTTGLRRSVAFSTLIAFGVAAAVTLLIGRNARTLATVLVVEAIAMYALPTLSSPRGGRVDIPAVHFLRDNIGLQRFFTLGPFQPNYGAFFRVASINYNYLPNSQRWYQWVKAHLDRDADPVVFNGQPRGLSVPVAALRKNLAAYEEVGVRFVIAPVNNDPLGGKARKVYSDPILDIYELPGAKPYFDSVAGKCRFEAAQRNAVVADCDAPERIFRRELFDPGWTATVGGREVTVQEHLGLFQGVELPAGRSEVRFDYAPRHIGWAWLAMLAGLLALATQLLRRVRRSEPRSRSAT